MKDLLMGIEKRVQEILPQVQEHYHGGIMEGFSPPAFAYIPMYFEGKRVNAHYKRMKAEVQVIFFETKDGYNKKNFVERMKYAELLCNGFDTFRLNIDGRVLHFTYEQGEADEQLAFYLRTEWMERKDTPEFEAAEKMDAAETLTFAEKVGVQ